ncbi:MAG: flagellar hook-basal body complex protein, partial [Synergistaceae bacterium]|nr:flagellar hook-basal body complex protein [Synergistaceae bacterium]
MQRSLYTAVTGVKSHQTYLDVTSQNIANVNTVGYKRDTIQFADMIYQTIRNEFGPVTPPGGINPAQVGLGVRVASIDPCFVQGALQSTEIPTDMAISGDGFFVVKNGDNELYTRAGNFALDFAGNLVMQGNGYLVQGYKFNGTSRGSTPEDIVIPVGDVIPQKATTLAAFRCNLDSGAEARIKDLDNIPAGADKVARPFDYTGIGDLFASVSNATGQGTITAFGESMKASCDWKDNFVVYDAEGSAHSMVVTFRKVLDRPADPTATPPVSAESEWDWYAYYTDSDGTVQPQYGQGAGTMVFGDDGLLKRTYTYKPDPLAPNPNATSTPTGAQYATWGVIEKIVDKDDPGYNSAIHDALPTGLVVADFNVSGSQGSVSNGVYSSNLITLDFLGSEYAKTLGLTKNPIDGVT